MNDKLVAPITNDDLMSGAKKMAQNKMPYLDS